MKKLVSLALVLLIGLSLLTPGALAQGGGKAAPGPRSGQKGGQPPSGGQGGGNGPGGSPAQEGSPQQSAPPQGDGPKAGQEGQRDGTPPEPRGKGDPFQTGKVEESIAALENEDTAKALTALLEAYKTAAAGEDREAARQALQALLEAMKEAGLQTEGKGMPPEGQPGQEPPAAPPDTDQIAKAIAGMSDSEAAATLTALLEAYQTAAAGEDQQATQTALEALLEALKEAGLETQAGLEPSEEL